MRKIELLFLAFAMLLFVSCGEDSDGDAFEEQLAFDILLIDDYLNENNIEAIEDASGIRYVVDEEGTGDSPSSGDVIAAKFELFLFDGEKVEEDTIGITTTLDGNIVRAWEIMVPQMAEGEVMTIYTPSGYGFGTSGTPTVPPNTNLIYRIELLAKIDDANDQFEVDLSIIDEFLLENQINYEVDDSGIRFTTITEGVGEQPSGMDAVTVIYEGTLLNGTVFDESQDAVELDLFSLIEAWQIMLPTMSAGGRIQMYCPSRYGYGTSGSGIIAPNTILVFDIELLSFE